MSRQFFHNQNKEGESYSFVTNKNGAFYYYFETHDPYDFPTTNISAVPGFSVRIDPGDGSQPVAPNTTKTWSLTTTSGAWSHTYGDASGKTFSFSCNKLEDVKVFNIGFSNAINNVFTGKTSIDLTPFKKIYKVSVARNSNITGITFDTDGTQPVNSLYFNQCDLRGDLDLSSLNMSSFNTIYGYSNSQLTGITFPANTKITGNNYIYSCNLTGHIDLSGLIGVSSQFRWEQNSNLTGVTFPSITGSQGTCQNGVQMNACDLYSLDLSPMEGCGRVFRVDNNVNLSSFILPTNTRNCITLNCAACNLSDLDLSGTSGLTVTSTSSSDFRVDNNANLSAVTTTDGLNTFSNGDFDTGFYIDNTNLPFFNVSGSTFDSGIVIQFHQCPSLTAMTFASHPNELTFANFEGYSSTSLLNIDISAIDIVGSGLYATSNVEPTLDLRSCSSLTAITTPVSAKTGEVHINFGGTDISGTLDLTNYTGLMKFDVSGISGLTGLNLPNTTSTRTLTNATMYGNASQKVFEAASCDLGYVDFKPMSGVTLNSSSTIFLLNNNMTAGEVNQILVDFDNIGWLGVTLDISGTNAAPDGSSGGYDGITARNNLTGNSWTITHS